MSTCISAARYATTNHGKGYYNKFCGTRANLYRHHFVQSITLPVELTVVGFVTVTLCRVRIKDKIRASFAQSAMKNEY